MSIYLINKLIDLAGSLKTKTLVLTLFSTFILSCQQQISVSDDSNNPIEVKVVVVTMFEFGEDTGDSPGEFQHWRERQDLSKRFSFPQSHHDIFMNEETGVLGIVTGMGTSRSSSAVMALGLDPRFDLSKAYWLVAGISGGDPKDVSLGSAVWATYLVDGDFGHEIDSREIPDDWETGYFPLFSKGPYDPNSKGTGSEVFKLNSSLSDWAYSISKNVELTEPEKMKSSRAKYKTYPKAILSPTVMQGDHLAAMTFWHGDRLNEWANKWVKYWTKGKGEFVTSAMEDTGSYQSLLYLDNAGKADIDRFMVLRTVSNYTVPPDGISAAQNLISDGEDYGGMGVALESAYRVGSTVVNHLVDNWSIYRDSLPYEKESSTEK
jgi:purine nucleoside permease